MSDVSGIPYMGPMGQGNFFAPTFSYNPQMSAGQIQSAYMPEFYNNQNVVNNLYGGGANAGFGQLTNYYSQLAANQLSGIGSAKPIGFYDNSVVGPYGGNGGNISPEQRFMTNGGGYNFPSIPDYSGGGGAPAINWNTIFQSSGGGLGGSPSLNLNDVQTWAGNWNTPSQSSFGGGGMGSGMLSGLGGLGGAGYTPQPGQSLDWSTLFGGSGGGARADPYPGMSMPGGLSSPINAQQQQPIDYGSLFGRGVGGTDTAAASTPMTYDQMGQAQRDLATVSGAGPGLGGAPAVAPDIQRTLGYDPSKGPVAPSVFDTGTSPLTGTQDTGPYGGGAGIGGLDTGRAIGEPYTQAAEPQRGMLQAPVTEAYNPYFDVTSPSSPGAGAATDTRTGGALTPGGGLTATDLSAQARARLAELMAKPKEPSPAEVFAGDKPVPTEGRPEVPDELAGEAGRGGMVGRAAATDDPYAALPGAIPLPRERPEGANAPRPPAALGTTGSDLGYLPGRSAHDLQGVNPRFAKALAEYARQYNAGQDQYDLVLRSGLRSAGQGQHTRGQAVDINLVDRRNGERLTDYQTRDPVVFRAYQDNANQFHQFLQQNYPDLAAQHRWGGYFWDGGPGGRGSQDIMHHDLGGSNMAAGSWAGGLSQQSADAYGLPYGGGTKTPYPSFNFDWSDAPIKDVGPMPLTYKSPDGRSVYQIDPDTGQRVNVPIISAKNPSELSSRDFVPAAAGSSPAEAPPLPAQGPANQIYPGADAPRPPADIPTAPAEAVPLPTARPAAANIAQANSLLDTTVGNLVQKNSPSDASRVPSSIASQTLREALGNAMTGGLIRSGIEPYLPKLGVTPAEFDKAYSQGQRAAVPRFGGSEESAVPGAAGPGVDAQDFLRQLQEQSSPSAGGTGAGTPAGNAYWDIPKEGTPRYNAEVYEPMSGGSIMRRPEQQTTGGASHYENFPRTGDVEDRRNEVLGRDQLAALKAMSSGIYYSDPEPAGAASNPLSIGLGLGDRDLPMPAGSATGGMARTRGIAADPEWDSGGTPDMQRLLGYTPREWPAEAYPPPASGDPWGTATPDYGGGVGQGFTPAAAEEFTPTRSITDLPSTPDSSLIGQGMGGKGSQIAGVDPITAQYLTMEPRIGADMQKQFKQYPGSFIPYDQQRQLQEQNVQSMQDLESNPTAMRTMLGLLLGEMGRGANAGDERIQVAETMFNRAAQQGKSITDILSGHGPGGGAAYYPDSLRNLPGNLAYMDAHPEVKARLMDELRTAGYGGSTLSNLATHNASLSVGEHVPAEAVAAHGPINQESFYNKTFPYSTIGVYQGDPSSTLRWYNQNAPVGQNTFGPLPGSGRR